MKIEAILIALVVLAAGCISAAAAGSDMAPYCSDLAVGLQNSGKACACAPTREITPELAAHEKEISGACRCVCNVNGTTASIIVARSK